MQNINSPRMRRLADLKLRLVEESLDLMQFMWKEMLVHRLEQPSLEKLLEEFLQSDSDYTAVGLVSAGHP